ncbi:MAG: hydrolase [Cytophagales bacterium]|nr:hydrolase [Armatimonadota bacterium]
MKPLRIALLQTAFEPGPEAMIRKFRRFAREAVSRLKADLICLPEFSLSPYFALRPSGAANDDFLETVSGGPTGSLCAEIARELGVHVIGSLYEQGEDRRRFDTSVLYDRVGTLAGMCRKQHIPDDIGYYERDYFGPADGEYPVFALGEQVQIAVPTCYDQWFPELARIHALKGAELIVYPTAIGSEPSAPEVDSQEAWITVNRANAITNGIFVAAINRVGSEQGTTFYGSSLIIAPGGEVLAQGSRDREEIVVADLDPAALLAWRRLFPLLHRREPATYTALCDPALPRFAEEGR